MDEHVRAGKWIALRSPSDLLKVLEIQPNTSISLGKFGTFQANHLIGRPFHITYEILDKPLREGGSNLRIVPTSELHEIAKGDVSSNGEANAGGLDVEVVNDDGKVVMRTNQHILAEGGSQKLTSEEIEAMKKADSSGGKEIIAKILESHSALDQKTAFSLAKYTLRKTKKYMKRFTVLPVDIPLLITWLLEGKDAPRIMELRDETLSLVMSRANVHWGGARSTKDASDGTDHNRWLAVDETGGLLVASMAEHMGILHPGSLDGTEESDEAHTGEDDATAAAIKEEDHAVVEAIQTQPDAAAVNPAVNGDAASEAISKPNPDRLAARARQVARIHAAEIAMSGTRNTITLVHQNVQPNLSLLTYFGFNASNPDSSHPLYTNLKLISFLQLLRPEEDYACREPPEIPEAQLQSMKSRQKSAYYRKRRRWHRTTAIVDETQAGGFAGLVVASVMTPTSVLHRLIPLLRGGAQVVVYSPTIEPLTELLDCYSKHRRTAFTAAEDPAVPSDEFPVDPRLLIGASLHTARLRPYQVLPGRTHPHMTGRGGAEGYVFVGTRVHPVVGKIEARGAHKRRKTDLPSGTQTPQIKTLEPTDIQSLESNEGPVVLNGVEMASEDVDMIDRTQA